MGPEHFWGVDKRTLYRFTGGTLTTRALPVELEGFGNIRYAEDEAGVLWFGTADGRIARLDTRDRVTFHHPKPVSSGTAALGADPDLVVHHRDSRGQIWRMRVDQDFVRHLRVPDTGHDQEVKVRLLFDDRENNLWLSSDHGLYRVRRRAITTYSRQHGLAGRNVYPVFQDRDGAVWIGAWDGGVSRWEEGRFTNYTRDDGLASTLISALAQDRQGRVWVASHHDRNGGLRVLRNGRRVEIGDEIVPQQSTVNVIHEDRSGALWFGSSVGLVRYANGGVTRYTTKDGLPSDDTHVIAEDASGRYLGRVLRWPGAPARRRGQPLDRTRGSAEQHGPRAVFRRGRRSLDWHVRRRAGALQRRAVRADRKPGRAVRRWGVANPRRSGRQLLDDVEPRHPSRGSAGLMAFAAAPARRVASMGFGTRDGLLNAECNGGSSPAGVKARDGTCGFRRRMVSP